MTLLDIPASDAAKRAVFGSTLNQNQREFLESRLILSAFLAIGGRNITGRHGPLLYLPYRPKMGKSYEPGSDSPWLQFKPKNVHLPLFNIDRVDFSKPWILTEGEWDALSSMEVGFHNVCSLPDGAVQPSEEFPAKSGKLRSIRDAWPKIQAGGGRVILALDNDAPGEVTKQTLIDIFGRWRCAAIDWPEHENGTGLNGQCKDFNEVLLLLGHDELERIIRDAKPLKLEGVFKPSEIPRRPKRVYYPTGIPGMDEHIKLFRGGLTVLTGHTSHGKSNVLFSILAHLAECGLKIALGSFEAEYWEDILPWFNSYLHGDSANEETEKAAHGWLQDKFVFISHEIQPLQSAASVEWFIGQAQDAKGRFGIDVLVGDPWNKLQHKRKPYENETEYIGRALSELRNFAQAYDTIVIIAAHPTKDSGKEGEVPTEFDIHGSMNWGNAADHVLIVYRPDKKYTTTLLRVAKSRIRQSGTPGEKWFVFSTRTNRYTPCVEHLIPKLDKKETKRRKSAWANI